MDILIPGVYGGPAGPNPPLAKVGANLIEAKLKAVAATTEVIAYDTTMLLDRGGLMDYALWNAGTSKSVRQAPRPLPGMFLTLLADQDLQIFHRHLAANSATWRDLKNFAASPASPTEYVASGANPLRLFFRFGGDDHQIVIKTKATPPTVVELALQLTDAYFVPTT